MNVRGIALSVALAGAAGCASETVIDGTDRSVFFPAVRANIRLSEPPRPEGGSEGGAPASDRSGTFLDLEVMRGAGDDAQNVASGDQIEFGGAVFAGPAVVHSDFEIVMAEACLRTAMQIDRHAVFSAFAGLGMCRADVELSSGATHADDVDHAFNALLGGSLCIPFSDRFEAEGRIAGTLVPVDHAKFWEASAGLRVRATRHMGLFAGWRQLAYELERTGSDVELALSGPTVVFELGF